MIRWLPTEVPELSFAFVAGVRIERLAKSKGNIYSIGDMEKSLIKFASEYTLYKYLTV